MASAPVAEVAPAAGAGGVPAGAGVTAGVAVRGGAFWAGSELSRKDAASNTRANKPAFSGVDRMEDIIK